MISKNLISELLILLTALVLSLPFNGMAQCDNLPSDEVHFNLYSLQSPANLWSIEDVLNIQISNNAGRDLDMRLIARIYESDVLLYEVSSTYFLAFNGFNNFEYVNPASLQSIEVQVGDIDDDRSKRIQETVLATGTLPAGDYEICIEAWDINLVESYGNCCINQYVASPSPPELIYPTDESFVMEDLPIFLWLPPMPLFAEVHYTIEIVEVLDSQIPTESMDANYIFFAETGIDMTSFQYPVVNMGFVRGARYAWRVGAHLNGSGGSGVVSTKSADVVSPVWSFTFQGTETLTFDEPFQFRLIGPEDGAPIDELPFFEWSLINPSAQTAENRVFDEDIYFDLEIWEWPDGLDASEAGWYIGTLGENDQVEAYFEEADIDLPYFNIAETHPDTLKAQLTYLWRVTAIKDEAIIAESDINTFSFIRDDGFEEAAISMLKIVDNREDSEIYGLVEPLAAGEIITSEEPSDIDSIRVESLSYLFIIDDKPWARFGHPVRYALVDKETSLVKVYGANWFPDLKSSDAGFKSTGTTNISDTDIGTLVKGIADKPSGPRLPAVDIDDFIKSATCPNIALVIDAGDYKNRKGATNNNASVAASDADLVQEVLEKDEYSIYRFSQYWDYKDGAVKAIPVDPEAHSAAEFIKASLLQFGEIYSSLECCSSSSLEFNLFIYINANALQESPDFKIYKSDGSGVHENINYFDDVLKHMQALPQCVKISLLVDANFSGVLVNSELLDASLKRGNFQILAASGPDKLTWSGVDRVNPMAKNEYMAKLAGNIAKIPTRENKKPDEPREKSITAVALAVYAISANKSFVENLVEGFPVVLDEIKQLANTLNQDDPEPQLARMKARYEDTVYFPPLNQQSKIKDFEISPINAANLIPDKENGKFVVYAKIQGDITVTIIYEDGTRKEKLVKSKWGDGT